LLSLITDRASLTEPDSAASTADCRLLLGKSNAVHTNVLFHSL